MISFIKKTGLFFVVVSLFLIFCSFSFLPTSPEICPIHYTKHWNDYQSLAKVKIVDSFGNTVSKYGNFSQSRCKCGEIVYFNRYPNNNQYYFFNNECNYEYDYINNIVWVVVKESNLHYTPNTISGWDIRWK